MIIEIETLDTVVFKNAKPFSRDNDTWTNSLNFPTPSTIYGALRATYFSQNSDDFKKIDKIDETQKLKINSILFFYDNSLIFESPKDCIEIDEKASILKLKENSLTNSKFDYILSADEEVKALETSFFKKSIFKRYLDNKDKLSYISIEDFLSKEGKVGIGLDKKTKTTKEGLLYRLEMLRYKKFKIIVDFDNLELNSSGLMKLGGEAKGATYKEIELPNIPQIQNITTNIFKLYLLTPAIFEKGYIPNRIDENSFEWKFKGLKVKLLTCAIGKYQSIGGFDIKKNKPKKMFKAVPAGSVYYFELLEGKKEDLIEKFNLKSISDFYSNEGYGIVILGDVKK